MIDASRGAALLGMLTAGMRGVWFVYNETGAPSSETEKLLIENYTCSFHNFESKLHVPACSPFALSRVPQTIVHEAKERAIKCAAHYQTDCVLSADVGLQVPSAFIYDSEMGLKALVAPTFTNKSLDLRYVKVYNPEREMVSTSTNMFREIEVTALVDGVRTLETMLLSGVDAYCIQALRMAYTDSCWTELD